MAASAMASTTTTMLFEGVFNHEKFTVDWPRLELPDEKPRVPTDEEAKKRTRRKVCINCGESAEGRENKCNGCHPRKRARYCDRICQRAHWEYHKLDCPRDDLEGPREFLEVD